MSDMKPIDEIPLGYGDVVQIWSNGVLLVGDPHRNNHMVVLRPADMWRLRKALKKAAQTLTPKDPKVTR